jgi:hypothetical protein
VEKGCKQFTKEAWDEGVKKRHNIVVGVDAFMTNAFALNV